MDTSIKCSYFDDLDSRDLETQTVQCHTKCLGENMAELDRHIKQLLKVIGAGAEVSSYEENQPYAYLENRSELFAHLEEFNRQYDSLAECYGHLTEEMQRCGLVVDKMEYSDKLFCVSEKGSCSSLLSSYETDEQGASWRSDRKIINLNISPTSECGSDLSLKEDTQSLSFSDLSSLNQDSCDDSYDEVSDHGTDDDMDKFFITVETEDYEKLLGKLVEYESIVNNLQIQIDHANIELKARETEIETEKKNISEMHNQVIEMKIANSESEKLITIMTKELRASNEKLKSFEEEHAKLKKDMIDQIIEALNKLRCERRLREDTEKMLGLELQKRISEFEDDKYYQTQKYKQLLEALVGDCEMILQNQISGLSQENMHLKEMLEYLELRQKSLQDDIVQLKEDRSELQGLHDIREMGMRCEIHNLQAKLMNTEALICKSLDVKIKQLESMNSELKSLHDAKELELQCEINNLKAKLMNTEALICQSFDVKIKQLESVNSELKSLHDAKELDLQCEISNLKVKLMNTEALICKSFDVKIKQLESLNSELKSLHDAKELELQCEINSLKASLVEKDVRAQAFCETIAEEKREVIRQLCESIEYYRSNYLELSQPFSLKKFCTRLWNDNLKMLGGFNK